MKSICVFCGSSYGALEVYSDAARQTGKAVADNGYRLVYGGAKVGLMGVVADAALEAGGEVVGVLPRSLQEKEIGHEGLNELHLVDSMGVKVDGDPDLWKIVDGKLYLNLSESIQERWNKDIPGFVKSADENWTKIEDTDPSTL